MFSLPVLIELLEQKHNFDLEWRASGPCVNFQLLNANSNILRHFFLVHSFCWPKEIKESKVFFFGLFRWQFRWAKHFTTFFFFAHEKKKKTLSCLLWPFPFEGGSLNMKNFFVLRIRCSRSFSPFLNTLFLLEHHHHRRFSPLKPFTLTALKVVHFSALNNSWFDYILSNWNGESNHFHSYTLDNLNGRSFHWQTPRENARLKSLCSV